VQTFLGLPAHAGKTPVQIKGRNPSGSPVRMGSASQLTVTPVLKAEVSPAGSVRVAVRTG
jgi:hypothetical protein